MKTYNVMGVPVDVDNVQINSDGEIENWDVYIGGVEIIHAAGWLDRQVCDELDRMILKEARK